MMMVIKNKLICCVFVINVLVVSAAVADKEEKSEEVAVDQESIPASNNDTTHMEIGGALDSHEAMNNREISPIKVRKKRSYEFITGLVFNNNNNNNNKNKIKQNYETTRKKSIPAEDYSYANIERPIIRNKDSLLNHNDDDNNKIGPASELLLELIVKIASNPEKWDKVHALLQRIESDIETTKNLVSHIKKTNHNQQYSPRQQSIQIMKKEDEFRPSTTNEDYTKEEEDLKNLHVSSKYTMFKTITSISTTQQPPEENELFDLNKPITKVTMINNNNNNDNNNKNFYATNNHDKMINKLNIYAKNFAYHRVTGKPFTVDKKPKAYIAVSVVAPQQIKIGDSQEDVALENELLELKPWTGNNNKSRWIMQSNENTEPKK